MKYPKKLYLEVESTNQDEIDYTKDEYIECVPTEIEYCDLIKEDYIKVAVYELKEVIEAKIDEKIITRKVKK